MNSKGSLLNLHSCSASTPSLLIRYFECSVCGKIFPSNSSLTRHMVTHTGRKEFNCNICDKVFSQKPHLNRHMVTHKKDFKCSVCGEEFALELALTRHMVRHTGEYKYKCNICDKGFSLKAHLNRHMVKHTGEYKYTCNVCGKGFSFESYLTKHIVKHTVKNMLKCSICGKMFSKKSSLRRHMATHTHMKKQTDSLFTKMSDSKSSVSEHLENKEVIEVCEMESETVVVLDDRYVTTDPLKTEIKSEDMFTLGNDETPAVDPLNTENEVPVYELLRPDVTIRGADDNDEAFTIRPMKTEHEYSNTTTLKVKEEHSVWNVATNLVTEKGIDSVGDEKNDIVKREEGFDYDSS